MMILVSIAAGILKVSQNGLHRFSRHAVVHTDSVLLYHASSSEHSLHIIRSQNGRARNSSLCYDWPLTDFCSPDMHLLSVLHVLLQTHEKFSVCDSPDTEVSRSFITVEEHHSEPRGSVSSETLTSSLSNTSAFSTNSGFGRIQYTSIIWGVHPDRCLINFPTMEITSSTLCSHEHHQNCVYFVSPSNGYTTLFIRFRVDIVWEKRASQKLSNVPSLHGCLHNWRRPPLYHLHDSASLHVHRLSITAALCLPVNSKSRFCMKNSIFQYSHLPAHHWQDHDPYRLYTEPSGNW